jgi:hypothetical protein
LSALCDDAASFAAEAPAISGWGVAKQVHHVTLELRLIARAIDEMLQHPELGAGLAPTHPWAMRVLEQGHFPRGSGQAPQDVVPDGTPEREETRQLIESARAMWDTVTTDTEALARSIATHPHPILGPFTCAHWLRFIPIHTAHHLKIVRDILDANGIETPYDASVENVN